MYIWARLPGGLDDLELCMSLVASEGVALSPGRGFGPGGRGHVRIALVQPAGVLRGCAARIGRHLQRLLAAR
jgi:aspartate/methionine/tyrosine aminotransferase